MRLILESDCATARLEGRCSVQLLDAIDHALTFYEPGFRFTPQYKRGLWDGKHRLFNRKRMIFPAGLLDRVVELLQAREQRVEIDDRRPDLPLSDEIPSLTGVQLYPEQINALRAFTRVKRGCLQLPTGSGKTEIAAALVKMTTARALVIVDRKGLLSQTADRLTKRLGERVGMFGSGFRDLRRRVTVATIQSLWRHRNWTRERLFPEIGVLIVDECHAISPKMWFRTLATIPAPVRLGLSATIREASRRLIVESFLGPIVHEDDAREMIKAGRLAEPRVWMLKIEGFVPDELDPEGIYTRGVVRNVVRNRAICDAVAYGAEAKKPVLVLVVRIEHGTLLREMLEQRGLDVPFLWGHTPLDEIDKAKRQLAEGRVPGLIASTIFDFGHDIPEIRLLVPAGAQRSPLRVIQRVGRPLRRKPHGENVIDVLDFYDCSHRMLKSQADDRRRTYKRKYGSPILITALGDMLTGKPLREPVR